ncbi:hypothetical protein LVJ94_44920 [Pendulispora rubella]|uniref:Uncharacterized protein n=1 Tax=Pendulispora rubella TaxID=2741070 RepID=A0ABZ2KZL2_9BACT
MNFGYMLRFAAISVGVGLGTAVGCGGANSSDLLDPNGPGPGSDGGGNPGFDSGGGRDTGSGSDTGTDANEPEEDSGQPLRGVRCDNGSGTQKLCSGGQPLCCIERAIFGKSYSCLGSGGDCQPSSTRWSMRCDSNDDCTQGRRCCGHLSDNGGGQQHFDRISCDATERCGADSVQVCTTDEDCRGSDRCSGIDPENSVYRFCQ